MGTINITGLGASYTLVPDNIIKNLYKANGDSVKVILCLLNLIQNNMDPTLGLISKNTGLTDIDIISAIESWDQIGVLTLDDLDTTGNMELTFNSDSKQEYSKPIVTLDSPLTAEELGLKELFDVIEGISGSPLSPQTLSFLRDLKVDFGFDDEAIVVLYSYCHSKNITSVKYMNKIAMDWKSRGITTGEEGNTEIRLYEEKRKNYRDLFRFMGFDPSAISEPQEIQMNKWYEDMEFSHEVIKAAAERCISAIGKGDMKYIEGILNNWKKLGIKTVNDIESKDAKWQKKAWVKKDKNDVTPFNDYQQRDYEYGALEEKLLGWKRNDE